MNVTSDWSQLTLEAPGSLRSTITLSFVGGLKKNSSSLLFHLASVVNIIPFNNFPNCVDLGLVYAVFSSSY